MPSGKAEKGQRRALLTRPNQERGAFAEYIAVKWDEENWLVPDEVTDEQAATTPVPAYTAVVRRRDPDDLTVQLGLFGKTRLALPQPPRNGQGSSDKTIYVHAGSTSVGVYVIQLAKMAGLRVISSSSEHNWPLLRKLGADEVLDYRDSDLVEKVKKLANGGVDAVYDCFTVRHRSHVRSDRRRRVAHSRSRSRRSSQMAGRRASCLTILRPSASGPSKPRRLWSTV